jgi:prevent-host-death family protein
MSETADHTVSATEARNKLSELLSHTQYSDERTILTRHGKPVAALVSIRDLDALEAFEDAMDVKRARESIDDAREHGGTKSLESFREELEAKRTE